MHTFPAIGPVDTLGRLLHEDDAAAQLALSMSRVEAALAAAGRSTAELRALRVLTTDRRGLDQVYDVLTERLDALGIDPVVTVEVARLPVPGMVVALVAAAADVRAPAARAGVEPS
ncbi:Rid family hydrolase [uncultured Nocardioides sp.]|uniref:Rid family hydrolase n=1 Tax=uncultured Nocardioides sp. TaxID=198441 RepID=UPI0025FEDC39|nr:Rid family hydrolase [uncultured Nocardioides sp.]